MWARVMLDLGPDHVNCILKFNCTKNFWADVATIACALPAQFLFYNSLSAPIHL